MKGIRLPLGFADRSERLAMSGSVTASKILPRALIPPMMVTTPKITLPCGRKRVCPSLTPLLPCSPFPKLAIP